jgi:hypothetical protein
MNETTGERTVRGIYDDGELRFAEPVNIDGCWSITITFVEELDEHGMPLEANPHRPEMLPVPDRLEELHRKMEGERPKVGPF